MSTPQRSGEQLLNSVRRTCDRLDVGHTTVYKMLKDGKLEAVKIGGKTLITEASILRLVSPDGEIGEPVVARHADAQSVAA